MIERADTPKPTSDGRAQPGIRSTAGTAAPGDGIRVVSRARRRDDAAGARPDTVEVAVHGTARFAVDQAAPPIAAGWPGDEIGLGLSLVRRFAEKSCGRLEVAGAAGPATIVRPPFPLADGEAPA